MNVCENEASFNDACRRQKRLRRSHSEKADPQAAYGTRGNPQDLERLPVRAQSLTVLVVRKGSERPAISVQNSDSGRTKKEKCDCSTTQLTYRKDSACARSSGSLSATSFNLRDDDSFVARERGSRTSIANVKSREDLVMSDHSGTLGSQLQPTNSFLFLKVAQTDGQKQAEKRTKKRRPDKDRDKDNKEKLQKDSAGLNVKTTAPLDSPGVAKSKHKHAAASGQEMANWQVWNTTRSSRTRLNESCSEQDEAESISPAAAADDASWQLISILSFRHGQRDESKYRQLSAGDSSASDGEDADASLPGSFSSRPQVAPPFASVDGTLHLSESPSTRVEHQPNWAKWECIEAPDGNRLSETSDVPTAEWETVALESLDARNPERSRPDALLRSQVPAQDVADVLIESTAEIAAESADTPPCDSGSTVDPLPTHEQSISVEVVSGSGKQHPSQGAFEVSQRKPTCTADARDASDEEQQRTSDAAPPPPPPRRTLPVSNTPQTTQQASSQPARPSSTTDMRSVSGRLTPSEPGLALLPPPPSVPRRSSAGSKVSTIVPSRSTTKRQHWLARFDDDEDSTAAPSPAPSTLVADCPAAVRFDTTDYDVIEDEEADDASFSDEQARMMAVACARRRLSVSSTANAAALALTDGTSSLGRKKQNKRLSSASSSGRQDLSHNLPANDSPRTDSPTVQHTPVCHVLPPRAQTITAFANLSFVDYAGDSDPRSARKTDCTAHSASSANLQSTVAHTQAHTQAQAQALSADESNRPANKVNTCSLRTEKESTNSNSRRTLLGTFLRKPHLSNDSSSDSSSNAIAKDDDTPDSPTAFQHRRFPSGSPSCSSVDSDCKHPEVPAPSNAKRPLAVAQTAGGLLASLSAFTFPRGLRRGAAKKTPQQTVTSDVCG